MSQDTAFGPEEERRSWMGLLARSLPARLLALMPGPLPEHAVLRRPEIGAVMVRGRAGGTGAPFNLGEMTVTRASVQLASGEVGHAYVQGRDRDHALRAAVVDALMQGPGAVEVRATVLDPLAAEEAATRAARAARAARTKVEFFTLVRGEDA
jgi:alpha-D-ribose 1-methylphosphonate 5-triphosphate synthase subunit PhnG